MIRTRFGPLPIPNGGYRFRLYAPALATVMVESDDRVLPMDGRDGWWSVDDPLARPGTRYAFRLPDGNVVPDPASRFQPDGVHARSAVVALPPFRDRAPFEGRHHDDYVISEIHVGTFTPAGTFRAAIERLDALRDVGITAIELMPLAAFPGARGWGYDGVAPFAPFAGYGTPDDFCAFVDAAHARDLAVILDVVYNHFGPEGNYLHTLAPDFFEERVRTPWGPAIDVAQPAVRDFFVENVTMWMHDYRIDGLRLDATHALPREARPSFLHDLRVAARLAAQGRPVFVVAENEDNDLALLPATYDAQWNDDVHHALHVLLTGERFAYYAPFAREPNVLLARALARGFASGENVSRLRASRFVTFAQNHDQIGNRAYGDRLAPGDGGAALRAGAALLLLAPQLPMLFMGEEWGATTPFRYFCDFEEPLASAVRDGRAREFAANPAFAAAAMIPDPTSPATFAASKLQWSERDTPRGTAMLAWYRELLRVRRAVTARFAYARGDDAEASAIGATGLRVCWRASTGERLFVEANLGAEALGGFDELPPGTPVFVTHPGRYTAGVAPAWSVRYSLTRVMQ